ncbi:hypothetical protein D3C73_1397490 [compost metagenome]
MSCRDEGFVKIKNRKAEVVRKDGHRLFGLIGGERVMDGKASRSGYKVPPDCSTARSA